MIQNEIFGDLKNDDHEAKVALLSLEKRKIQFQRNVVLEQKKFTKGEKNDIACKNCHSKNRRNSKNDYERSGKIVFFFYARKLQQSFAGSQFYTVKI